MQQSQPKIQVSVTDQELRLMDGDQVVHSWPISTSKFGLGSEEGSFKTPLGKFRVAEEFGDDAPEGTIFKGRKPVGTWNPAESVDEDMVLTRILWLEGLEEQNANTKERYIYIHGTNDEEKIGEPASIGCVRMKNADVIALYDQVGVGTEVEIV
tara:strand:+ start:4058 stop:4519 length:462 start_codon:yes stop_codon:yes gene_type:complete